LVCFVHREMDRLYFAFFSRRIDTVHRSDGVLAGCWLIREVGRDSQVGRYSIPKRYGLRSTAAAL
jgi:hypothetical protein